MSSAISVATPDDADELAALINRAYEVESFFKIGPRTDTNEIAALLTQHRFLVAREGSRIAGCVLVELRPGDGYFGMLSVEPARQRAGLGRTLIAAAEEFCSEHGRALMSLKIVNLRLELLAFYGALGYRESGTEPWPPAEAERTSQPCHFLVMTKVLAARA